MTLRIIIVLVLSFFALSVSANDLLQPCPSDIFCHGQLLEKIQMHRIFNDSKTFVDMKMKYPPSETKIKFEAFMAEHAMNPGYLDIYNWVNRTFEPAGSEFENWIPDDWTPNPSFLNNIHDPAFRDWGSKLNDLWKLLGRKIKEEVKDHQELYSIIWVPHPAIVPGGRFREFYYWDSYWIIKGLLLSDMTNTAKGMLENFLYITDKYGFIPNGGRIYYMRRSQPPLLIPSIKIYYDATQDLDFIKNNIAIMEKEFNYWIKNHTVEVTVPSGTYRLAVYGDNSQGPRPESYYEDIHSAGMFTTKEEKEHHYSELKAAAESGWDFSSRWFISKNGTNEGNLTNLNCRSIVPVDLNSFIYENAVFLSEFHTLLNNTQKSMEYKKIAEEWLEAVNNVMWHDDVGAWLDYDLRNHKRREYFYPSNIAPLYNNCYKTSKRDIIIRKVRKYLQKSRIMDYKGGVPTSFHQTGEQWDFPNAWPPMQHLLIMGLDRTGEEYAQKIARDLALTWVRSNYIAFNETGHMFEKYNAETPGGNGGGGEYEIQLGFGWSNGVIMDLLDKYGESFSPYEPSPIMPEEAKEPSNILAHVDDSSVHTASTANRELGHALVGLLVILITILSGVLG